jgi:hypothetical protein
MIDPQTLKAEVWTGFAHPLKRGRQKGEDFP